MSSKIITASASCSLAQLDINFDFLQFPAAVLLQFVLSMLVPLWESKQLLLSFTNEEYFNAASQLLVQQHSYRCSCQVLLRQRNTNPTNKRLLTLFVYICTKSFTWCFFPSNVLIKARNDTKLYSAVLFRCIYHPSWHTTDLFCYRLVRGFG